VENKDADPGGSPGTGVRGASSDGISPTGGVMAAASYRRDAWNLVLQMEDKLRRHHRTVLYILLLGTCANGCTVACPGGM
jgi:hypothetical protein